MMKVKICGITNIEDAVAAADAGADALGFNFAQEARAKKRYIDPKQAARIIRELPPFVTTVAVCVNASAGELENYRSVCDYVQYHGDEPAESVAPYAQTAIKAFRLAADTNLDTLAGYPCRAHLLDAAVDGAYGGTGVTCDWDAAGALRAKVRCLILAGGLTPGNVADAVECVRPYAVDVAGGVESEPGKKDHERIRAFIHAAKAHVSG